MALDVSSRPVFKQSKAHRRIPKVTQVEINAGICGFTTTVRSEDKGGYKAVFQLESDCPDWNALNKALGGEEINVMSELFKDRQTGMVNSQILERALRTIPHASCPVISGLLKTLEVSVGLALPKDAAIVFNSDH
jgi:hypothetical protein